MADTQPPNAVASVRTYARDAATLSGKPQPAPVMSVPAPAPQPAPVVPPPPAPRLPPDPEKEAAITRLKARVILPSPAVEAPVLPPIPPVAKPIAEVPHTSAPIHTYTSDFAAHVQDQRASRISVLAAQQDSRAITPETLAPVKKNQTATILFAVALLVVGSAGVYGAYHYATRQVVPQDLFVPSLIFADEKVALSGTGEELRSMLANPKGAAELKDGGLIVTYITYATTTNKGTTELPATGGALIEALRLPAPDILLRNITPESTVGVVRAGAETRPFFLLRVESYERTYAGMLAWESTMERDLSVFYPAYPSEATSTPPTNDPFRVSFVDEIVENHDVRVLKDGENKTLMLYGYRDKQTLVIARDEAAFVELLSRLAATRAN